MKVPWRTQRLLCRPRLKEEESFTSIVVRAAVENSRTGAALLSMLSLRSVAGGRRADAPLGVDEGNTVAQAFDLTVAEIQRSTLARYDGVIVASQEEEGTGRWVARIQRTSASTARGWCLCPLCLLEDHEPHLRLQWRLAFMTMCPVHRVMLVGRCEHCLSPIFPLHPSIRSSSDWCRAQVHLCGQCGFDLRDSRTEVAVTRGSALTNLCADFESGAASVPGIQVVYGFQLLAGIRVLLATLGAARGQRLREAALRHRFGSAYEGVHAASTLPFESRALHERHWLLNATFALLEEWPQHFVRMAKSAGMTAVSFSQGGSAPYWLASIIRTELWSQRHVTSTRELEAARAVLQERGELVSKLRVKRMVGVAESKNLQEVVPAPRRRATSVEALEFFDHCEARIQQTPSSRAARDALCRDTLVLLLSAGGGQKIEVLCALTLQELQRELRRNHAVLSARSQRLATLQTHLGRGYLRNVRARFGRACPNASAPAFISRFGQPLEGHALRSRTSDLMARANLKDVWLSADALRGSLRPSAKP